MSHKLNELGQLDVETKSYGPKVHMLVSASISDANESPLILFNAKQVLVSLGLTDTAASIRKHFPFVELYRSGYFHGGVAKMITLDQLVYFTLSFEDKDATAVLKHMIKFILNEFDRERVGDNGIVRTKAASLFRQRLTRQQEREHKVNIINFARNVEVKLMLKYALKQIKKYDKKIKKIKNPVEINKFASECGMKIKNKDIILTEEIVDKEKMKEDV